MSFFFICEASILRVTGKDSPRYLNARLTNDIKTLHIGGACFAAALTPQGRTQGFFNILKLDEFEFMLICDGGDRDTVIAALRKYIVADRVSVEDSSSHLSLLHVASNLPPDTLSAEVSAALKEQSCILPQDSSSFTRCGEIMISKRRRSQSDGFDIIGPHHVVRNVSQCLQQLGEREWSKEEASYHRISAGILSFPSELNEDYLFAEAQLPHSVSFRKGCYVGQEVIEKIDSHGKVPFRVVNVRVRGNSRIDRGTDVYTELNSRPIGEVISTAAAPDASETVCFARIKSDSSVAPGGTVLIDSITAQVL